MKAKAPNTAAPSQNTVTSTTRAQGVHGLELAQHRDEGATGAARRLQRRRWQAAAHPPQPTAIRANSSASAKNGVRQGRCSAV